MRNHNKAEKVGLPVLTRCSIPEVCEGYLITLNICEVVEIKDIHNWNEVMNASLRDNEEQDLELVWKQGQK